MLSGRVAHPTAVKTKPIDKSLNIKLDKGFLKVAATKLLLQLIVTMTIRAYAPHLGGKQSTNLECINIDHIAVIHLQQLNNS